MPRSTPVPQLMTKHKRNRSKPRTSQGQALGMETRAGVRRLNRNALAITALCLLGSLAAATFSHHEGQVAQARQDAIVRLAPGFVRTPMERMSDWGGSTEDSMTPPDWRGTDLSLRWTAIGTVIHTPEASGGISAWGAWFVGQPGQPVSVSVSAQQAGVPLTRVSTGGRSSSTHTEFGRDFRPSTVKVTVDSGEVTVLPSPDGGATLSVPALPGGQQQALWVWATTATMVSQTPWLTQVRVGTLPYATVQRLKAMEDEVDEHQSGRLLAGTVALLLGVGTLSYGLTALARR